MNANNHNSSGSRLGWFGSVSGFFRGRLFSRAHGRRGASSPVRTISSLAALRALALVGIVGFAAPAAAATYPVYYRGTSGTSYTWTGTEKIWSKDSSATGTKIAWSNDKDAIVYFNTANVVANLTVGNVTCNYLYLSDGTQTFHDGTFTLTPSSEGHIVRNQKTSTFKNITFTSSDNTVYDFYNCASGASVTFDNCVFQKKIDLGYYAGITGFTYEFKNMIATFGSIEKCVDGTNMDTANFILNNSALNFTGDWALTRKKSDGTQTPFKAAISVTLGANNASEAALSIAGTLKTASGSTLTIDANGKGVGTYKILSAGTLTYPGYLTCSLKNGTTSLITGKTLSAIKTTSQTVTSGTKKYTLSSSDSKSVTLTIENTTCTVTLNGGTGVDKIYYRQGASGDWTQYSAAFTVNPGTAVQYYSTPKTNYASDQTQSNPGSETVNANKTITLTAKLTGGDITGATVTVSPTSATYTGSVIENPTVTVTLNGTDITSHCRCTWDDTLKNLGVYHLTVTARQDEPGYTFTGTATAHPTFTIKDANMPALQGKEWRHDVQSGSWSTGSNWNGGSAPSSATLGEFRDLDDKTTVNVDANATVKGIKFYNTAPLTMHITKQLTVNGTAQTTAQAAKYFSDGTVLPGTPDEKGYRSAPVTMIFEGTDAQLYISPLQSNYAFVFGKSSVANSGNESRLKFVIPQGGWNTMQKAAIAVDEAKDDSPTIMSSAAYFVVDARAMNPNQTSYLFYSLDGARIYEYDSAGNASQLTTEAEIQAWTKSDRFIIDTPENCRGVVSFEKKNVTKGGTTSLKSVAMKLTLVPATDIANAVVTLNKGAASYTGSAVEKPTLVSVTLGGVDITDQCYISGWKNAAGEEVNNLIAAGEYYPVVRAKLSSEEYCGVAANPPAFRIVSAYYHKSGTTDWTTVSGWYMNEALTTAATAYPDNYDAGVFVYSSGSAVNAVSGGTTTSRKVKLVSLKGGSGDSSLAAVYSTKLLAKLDEDSEVVSCETGVTALHDVRFEIDSGSASGATPSIEVKSGATLYADSMSAGNVKLELAAGSTLRLFPGLSSYGAGSGTSSTFGSFSGGAAGQTTTMKVENNTATFSGASGVSGKLDLQLKPGANNTTTEMLKINGAFTVGSGSTLKVDASAKTTAGTYPLVRATSFGGMTAAEWASAATVTATASGKAAKVVANGTTGLDLVVYDPTVTLDMQGGTGGSTSVTVTYGAAVPTITKPTKTGYTFGGYYTQTGGAGTQYIKADGKSAKNWDKTSATTLYAKWTANEYTITVSGGGSASPTKYTYNPSAATSVTMTPTTKTGYTFSNWTVSGASGATPTVSGNTVSITKGTYGNLTVTANWTANKYSIAYAGSGTLPTTPTEGTYDSVVTVAAPTCTGYTFAGWTVTTGLNTSTAKWGTSSSAVTTSLTSSSTKCVNGATGNVYFKNLSSAASGAVTLTATWTANTYTVSFNANGGTGGQTANVTATYGSAMPTITTTAPTKTGYTFGGWYDTNAATGGTQYYTAAGASARTWNKTANTTLYARWTAKQTTVSFDQNNGTGGQTANVTATYDSAMPTISAVPTRTGYTFTGYWDATSSGTKYYNADKSSAKNWNKTGSTTTLYAQWTANTYTVTLDNQNATTPGSTSVTATYGAAIPNITVPERTGYTFGGYYTSTGGGGTQYIKADGTSAKNWDKTSGVTLYAKWVANTYTITFDKKGGSGGTDSVTATYGQHLPSPVTVPTRTGYTFGGYWKDDVKKFWYDANGVSRDENWNIPYDRTLNAEWTANTYTVTFNANGGNTPSPASKSVTYDSTYGDLATCTRTGYTFAGWWTSASGGTQVSSTTTVKITAAQTLYAHWAANTYTVTLDRQSGGGGSASVTATYGAAMPTVSTPTRTGYTFGGYYTATGGGGTQYIKADGTSAKNWDKTADTTLYAKWTANTYRVEFKDNFGTGGMTSMDVTYGTTAPTVSPLPKATGYDFAGYVPGELLDWGNFHICINYNGEPIAGEGFNPVNITGDRVGYYALVAVWHKLVTVPTATTGLVYDGTSKTGVASGAGYSVTDGSAVKAGTYTATVSLKAPTDDEKAKGIEKYIWASDKMTDSKTVEFTIAKKDISSLTAFVPYNPEYTGSAIGEGVCSLEWTGGPALTKGTDYTVEIVNNVNVGTATVTFRGKGDNYTGEKVVTFDIQPATIDKTPSQSSTLTYTGLKQTPTVNAPTKTTAGSQTITWTYSATSGGTYSSTVPQVGPNANTYTIYYKATAANHNEKTGSFTVTIGKMSIEGGTANDLYYKGYNGYYANDVPFSVGGNLLESWTEYSAKFAGGDESINAIGTYSVTFTGKDNYTGTCTRNVKILKNVFWWNTDEDGSWTGEGNWTCDAERAESGWMEENNCWSPAYGGEFEVNILKPVTVTVDDAVICGLVTLDNSAGLVCGELPLITPRIYFNGTASGTQTYVMKDVYIMNEGDAYEDLVLTVGTADEGGSGANATVKFTGECRFENYGDGSIRLQFYDGSANCKFLFENCVIGTPETPPVGITVYRPTSTATVARNLEFKNARVSATYCGYNDARDPFCFSFTLGDKNTAGGSPALELSDTLYLRSGSTLTVNAGGKDVGTYPLVRAGAVDGITLDQFIATAGTVSGTKSGTYAKVVANGTTGLDLVVYDTVAKPTISKNAETYKGSDWKSLVSPSAAATGCAYTWTGDWTSAGSHSVKATLSSGYCWTDGSTGDVTLNLTINKASVTIPTANNEHPVYDGVRWRRVDHAPSEAIATRSSNIGQYGTGGVTFTLVDKANYQWSDGTTTNMTVNWTVAKKTLTVNWGSTTSWVYDGNSHVPTCTLEGVCTRDTGTPDVCTPVVSGEQTNVGNYTATVTSLTGAQCGYYQLLASEKTKAFSITAKNIADVAMTVTNDKWWWDGQPHVPTLAFEPALAEGIDYTLSATNASGEAIQNYATGMKALGTYGVRVTGQGNYSGTRADFTFTIDRPQLTWRETNGTNGTGAWTDAWNKPYKAGYANNDNDYAGTTYPSSTSQSGTIMAASGRSVDLNLGSTTRSVGSLTDSSEGSARVHDGTLTLGSNVNKSKTGQTTFENVTFKSSSSNARYVYGSVANTVIDFVGNNTVGVSGNPVRLRYYSKSGAIYTGQTFRFKDGQTTLGEMIYVDNCGPRTGNLVLDNARLTGTSFNTIDLANGALTLDLSMALGENNTAANTALNFSETFKIASGSTLTVDASAKGTGTYPLVRAGTLTVADGLDAWLAAQQAKVTAKAGTTATLVKNGANGIDLVVRTQVAMPTISTTSVTYTGSDFKSLVTPASPTGYAYTWTGDWTTVGTHSVTAKLSSGYCWADGSTSDVTLSLTIMVPVYETTLDGSIAVDPEVMKTLFGGTVSDWQTKFKATNAAGVAGWEAYVLGLESEAEWNSLSMIVVQDPSSTADSLVLSIPASDLALLAAKTKRTTSGGLEGVTSVKYELVGATNPQGTFTREGEGGDGGDTPSFAVPLAEIKSVRYFKINRKYTFQEGTK